MPIIRSRHQFHEYDERLAECIVNRNQELGSFENEYLQSWIGLYELGVWINKTG